MTLLRRGVVLLAVSLLAGIVLGGQAAVRRSEAPTQALTRETGFANGRAVFIVDHNIPLACGGVDAPSNMQWQTTAEGKAKDKIERKGCGEVKRE